MALKKPEKSKEVKMPIDWENLGMNAMGNVADSAIGAGMGLLLANYNDKRQLKQQGKLQELQMRGSKEMMDYQQAQSYDMWQKTNYKAQMEQLKKAGLNPALMYGMGGGGGGTMSSGNAQVSGGNAAAGGGEVQAMMGLQLQNKMMQAQIENIKADTTQKLNTTPSKDQGQQEITNRLQEQILNNVIKEITGKDMKEEYDMMSGDVRDLKYRAMTDELWAKSLAGQEINRLYLEGKLSDMNNAQVKAAIAGANKTEAEAANAKRMAAMINENITGKQLENAILKLEKELQEKTGLDRNSEGFLKLLGRLLISKGGL